MSKKAVKRNLADYLLKPPPTNSTPAVPKLCATLLKIGLLRELAMVVVGYALGGAFGCMVHYGLYSIPAFDDVESAKHRRIQNGSEWYAKRLSVRHNTYQPTSGWQQTQRYHKIIYGEDIPYHHFAQIFDQEADLEQVDRWCDAFRVAGASYAVLTSKHHDSFCLWPTKTTTFASRRDFVQRFKDACRLNGLKFGIYYSWSEFNRSVNKQYLNSIVVPQINELVRYAPDIFWFDGDWTCNTDYAQTTINQCLDRITKALPYVEINDRIGCKEDRAKDTNWQGRSTFRVYADRCIPDASKQPLVPWEHVNTIGYSWGRNKQQQTHDYKSTKQIMQLYKQVSSLGGNLLLNVGPNANGSLDPHELNVLQTLNFH